MSNKAVSFEAVHRLVFLRTLVAALGERAAPLWWRTQFLTEVGLRAMTRVFPRTAAHAALSSVTIAARADHDKRVGVGGRYHLFRLPNPIEHAVGLAASEDWFRLQVASMMTKGQDGLIQELAAMASGRVVSSAEGPVKLGLGASVAEAAAVEVLAAYYQASLQANRRAFPYFDEVEGKA